jgi:hypothetical protein
VRRAHAKARQEKHKERGGREQNGGCDFPVVFFHYKGRYLILISRKKG